MSDQNEKLINIDAGTFQRPLGELAEVLAQKVKREAPAVLPGPKFVAFDLHVLIRQAMHTYDLLFYINADDLRASDCYWKPTYSIIALPLIRNMIDCLYNITAILEDPALNGSSFRKSGYRKLLKAFDEDQVRFAGKQKWEDWIAHNRDMIDLDIRANDLSIAEVLTEPEWPTLGKYIRKPQPGGTLTSNQEFLKSFTYGNWREYSAMAHGAFEGLKRVALYYVTDSMPHEDRPKIDELHPRMTSMHLARAATILLCIVTELQAYFHFDGARIDQRIHKIWNALMQVDEVCELYDERYAQLMKDKQILP